MAIETKCPGCARLLRVADDCAGAQARCPQCSTIYVVPGGHASAAERSVPEPDDLWHMKTPEGQVYGPVARAELDQWLADGRIIGECLLRTDNAPEWRPADEYYGVLAPQNSASVAAGSPFADAGSTHTSGHVTTEPPDAAPYRSQSSSYVAPHRGALILILGILAWVFTCPIFSVMAWMMGASDLREMRAGRMDSGGMGLTQAGHILGIIYSLLWCAACAIIIFVFVLAAAMGAVR